MLCVCEKGTIVAFFFFTFANGFPPHVTERYPLLKRIVTFCGCKIWNVVFLNKKRNFSDLNDWPKGLMNGLIEKRRVISR